MDYNDFKIKQAAEIVQSFMMVSKTLAKFTQQNAESLGLTLQQLGILNTIYSSPLITLKEITEKLLIPKSTASVNVDELVNLGLVKHKASEDDRWGINLVLTDKGKEMSKKINSNSCLIHCYDFSIRKNINGRYSHTTSYS
jgi:MarR family transcriptional regulator, organic hydroperoxide resistance regulator